MFTKYGVGKGFLQGQPQLSDLNDYKNVGSK